MSTIAAIVDYGFVPNRLTLGWTDAASMLARTSRPRRINVPFGIDEFMFAKERNRCVTMRTDHCARRTGAVVAPRSYARVGRGDLIVVCKLVHLPTTQRFLARRPTL